MDGSDFGHYMKYKGWVHDKRDGTWRWYPEHSSERIMHAILYYQTGELILVNMYQGERYVMPMFFDTDTIPPGLTHKELQAWLVAYWSTAQ